MAGIPSGAGSLIGKHLGKYEIVALLALGGTAEIYLARIAGTNGFEKYVVIKCLHDHLADDIEFVKMFLDEARMAAILDHSNIVQTFELGEHEHRYYMVMEFLAGLSLAMVVRRAGERLHGGNIPSALILNIAAQAAAGLHYAHERQANGKPLNMVHRDISPQNLVISFEGVVKVVDFGIARAELRETKTKAGTIKGKFAYMSPEQCVATNVDRRTDVFALGVIVHELLTGRRLFKRNSPYETYQAVIECVVPPPSSINHELDPALDEMILRACAKDKDDRYPSAEAFGDAMQGYLHHRGKGSGPGEVGKFFDEHFAQELEEHSERMRELISGRDISVDTGVNWGEDDERRPSQTVDLGRSQSDPSLDRSLSLDTGDLHAIRASEASLEKFVQRLSTEDGTQPRERIHSDHDDRDEREEREDRDSDDGPPPEATRIETNPLEKIESISHEKIESISDMQVPTGTVTGGPAPLPAPPPAGPQKQVVNASASGRFPDLEQLATVVAGEDPGPPRNAPELAPTAAGPPIDPRHVGPYSTTQDAVRMSQIQTTVGDPDAMGTASEAAPTTVAPSSPYPVVQGGRPYSAELAPSNLSGRPSQRGFDPQHAANVMSPVGDQYPQAVDWHAAAARSAKALAPWQLALLFIGALGVALMLTIVIAKIIR